MMQNLSEQLQLSPTTAGVTLVALGNSAPDVFSIFAARSADPEAFEIGLGDLLGDIAFLPTIVLARVINVATKRGPLGEMDPDRDVQGAV